MSLRHPARAEIAWPRPDYLGSISQLNWSSDLEGVYIDPTQNVPFFLVAIFQAKLNLFRVLVYSNYCGII